MRSAEIKRKTKLRPVNRKRKRKADARNFGDEAKRVRASGRCVCNRALCEELAATGELTDELEGRWCSGPIVVAHDPSRGAGGGRFDIFNVCQAHHDEQHLIGIESFAAKYGLDLRAITDRIAVEHPEPLGIRGLADQFEMGEVLVDYDAKALTGWVERRAAKEERRPDATDYGHRWDIAETIARELNISLQGGCECGRPSGPAWKLCALALGWP